ncbi:MAG: hypothetical protein J6S21_00310 [Victivallales bacterium]|nr:hypothetical protein [Victivallales bacterium]
MKKLILCAVSVLFLALGAAADGEELQVGLSDDIFGGVTQTAQERGDTCRGKYLRTENRGVTTEKRLGCALVIEPEYGQPALQLAMQEIRHITEVRIYELEIREFVPDDNGITCSFVSKVVSGEVWEGEKTTRTETGAGDPLANTTVTVNSIPCRTDAQGLVRIQDGRTLDLLAMLDNLSQRTAKLVIATAGVKLPQLEYTVYRTMPQRSEQDEKRLEEPQEQDVLVAAQLDFALSRMKPEQEKLVCTASVAGDTLKNTGVPFPVTVTVENQGAVPTSCLLGRSFSRIPGLNGKLFYFGAIPPGGKRSFTRWMCVDRESAANSAFLEIRFSDSWSIPDKKIPIKLTVLHSAPLLME